MRALAQALAAWIFVLGLLGSLVSITIWSALRISHSLAELGDGAAVQQD